MKPVKLELELDSGLYEYDLEPYSNDEGSGYNVCYTSTLFSDKITTMLVHGLNTYNANMCKNLVDTTYIHSGDLKLDND